MNESLLLVDFFKYSADTDMKSEEDMILCNLSAKTQIYVVIYQIKYSV